MPSLLLNSIQDTRPVAVSDGKQLPNRSHCQELEKSGWEFN